MAASKKDYFGLSRIVSIILAIIPVTAWVLGVVTRFSEGKIVAGIIRIFGDVFLCAETNRQKLKIRIDFFQILYYNT